ncbi:MAG: fumarate reductase subunit C [Gemmatimonadaceae bacterium]
MISPSYSENHPKWLRQRLSTYWWLGKWPYVKFILREISSVFVAWFVIYLLLLVRAIARGDSEYQAFISGFSCHPVVLALNIVSFVFITFHAITWFAVAPQAIVAHMGTKKVPPVLIAAGHYGAWFVVSAALLFFLVR